MQSVISCLLTTKTTHRSLPAIHTRRLFLSLIGHITSRAIQSRTYRHAHERAQGMVSAPPASRNLGLGWLTSAGDWVHPALTWSYDGQGNLLTEATGGTTTSTYGYATSGNTVNELTSLAVSGQATRYYAYDKYGNPLSIGPSPTNPCPSSTSTCLGYDALARLSSVVEANNGPTIALTYNAMGLRASYTVTPYGASQPSLNEQFTYRGGQLAQTVTISGTTYTDTYVYSQHGMPLELLRTTNGVLNR